MGKRRKVGGGGGGGGRGRRGRGLLIPRQCPKTTRFMKSELGEPKQIQFWVCLLRLAEPHVTKEDSHLGLSILTRLAAAWYRRRFTPGSVCLLSDPRDTKEAKPAHNWNGSQSASAPYLTNGPGTDAGIFTEAVLTTVAVYTYSPSGRVIPKKIHTWVYLLTRRAAWYHRGQTGSQLKRKPVCIRALLDERPRHWRGNLYGGSSDNRCCLYLLA